MPIILVLIASALFLLNFKEFCRFLKQSRFKRVEGRVLSIKYFSYPFWGNHNFLEHQKQTRQGSIVTYRYEVGGTARWHTGKYEIGDLSLGGAILNFEKGNSITVFYDPKNPAASTLDRSLPGGVLLAALLVSLALFFGFWGKGEWNEFRILIFSPRAVVSHTGG